jgi:hypothetical protein
MSEQPEVAQQMVDLCSQFFPMLPSPIIQARNQTRLTEEPVLDAYISAIHGPVYVQCNCACK